MGVVVTTTIYNTHFVCFSVISLKSSLLCDDPLIGQHARAEGVLVLFISTHKYNIRVHYELPNPLIIYHTCYQNKVQHLHFPTTPPTIQTPHRSILPPRAQKSMYRIYRSPALNHGSPKIDVSPDYDSPGALLVRNKTNALHNARGRVPRPQNPRGCTPLQSLHALHTHARQHQVRNPTSGHARTVPLRRLHTPKTGPAPPSLPRTPVKGRAVSQVGHGPRIPGTQFPNVGIPGATQPSRFQAPER